MKQHSTTILLVHGGPGFDDSYFYPYFNNLKDSFDIKSYSLGSQVDDYSVESLREELSTNILSIKTDKIIIYAHSFASILIAGLSQEAWDKVSLVVLSNWIADSNWIDTFNNSYPEASNINFGDLKSFTISHLSYYFENIEEGQRVLDEITYTDEVFLKNQAIYENLDITKHLIRHKQKIISISSEKDKITPKNYIKKICLDIDIKNYNISKAGHFPFVENWPELETTLRLIVKIHLQK